MAASQAELALLIRARNLASGAIDSLHGSLSRVHGVAGRVGGAIQRVGGVVDTFASAGGPLGMLIGGVLHATGADKLLEDALGQVAGTIGRELAPTVQAVTGHIRVIVGRIQEWIARNQPLIRQIGSIAAFLADKLFAAIGLVVDVAGHLVGRLGDLIAAISNNQPVMAALRTVAGLVADAFGIFAGSIGTVVGWIQTLMDWAGRAIRPLQDLAGAIGSIPNLPGDIGRNIAGAITGHEAGGWAGLHGPELAWLGEKGPEYVIPHDALGRAAGGQPVIIQLMADGRELARIVDRHLFYDLTRAARSRTPG